MAKRQKALPKDATEAIRMRAAEFPDVVKGTSCNQSSFKTASGSFLFIGPGAKGVGFKAMLKLGDSMDQARALAAKDSERFEVGKTGWVTVRFSNEKPLPESIWEKWLKESYALCNSGSKKTTRKTVKKKSVGNTRDTANSKRTGKSPSKGAKKVARKKSAKRKTR